MARARGWKVVIVVLLVLLASAGGLLAMAGNLPGAVPGAAELLGVDRPRDLGVQATPDDRDQVVEKVSSLFKPAMAVATSGSKVQTGPAVIDREFTEAEFSALLAYPQGDDWPIQEGQVRIHADGMLELSLALEVERLEVGRIPMPSGVIGALDLAEMINAELRSLPGLQLTDLVFADGRVRVRGTYQP